MRERGEGSFKWAAMLRLIKSGGALAAGRTKSGGALTHDSRWAFALRPPAGWLAAAPPETPLATPAPLRGPGALCGRAVQRLDARVLFDDLVHCRDVLLPPALRARG